MAAIIHEQEAQLLARAESGDREAIATLLRLYEPLIRARFRACFDQQPHTLFDSSDFFATMLRRVDELASSSGEGLEHDIRETLHEIMLTAIADYARTLGNEQEAAACPHHIAGTGQKEDDARLAAALNYLDRTDQQIVRLRLSGLKHKAIAGALGLRTAAVRMRWIRLREQLRSALQ